MSFVFANVCVCECVYKYYTHQELICPQADDDDDDAVLCHAKKGTREKNFKNLLSLENAKRRKLITSCPASQH